jgi:hypothetical protein
MRAVTETLGWLYSGDVDRRWREEARIALDDKTTRIVLDERDLPTHWYNGVPNLPPPPSSTDRLRPEGPSRAYAASTHPRNLART